MEFIFCENMLYQVFGIFRSCFFQKYNFSESDYFLKFFILYTIVKGQEEQEQESLEEEEQRRKAAEDIILYCLISL